MKFLKEQRGVTLVETLVALSLFSILAVISGAIFLDIVQLEKKSAVQNVFYEDARIILQQISNEIQGGAIDYEEYYSINVLQNGSGYYGINYGAYGSRFYDPGKSLEALPNPTENPTNLGVECSFPKPPPPVDIADCEVIYTLSTDLNTGQNPFDYELSDKDASNALCDDPKGAGCVGTTGEVKELYLIDSTGTQKTIIARKKTTLDDWGVGIVRMYGRDLDQNGVMDTFSCNEEFSCFGEGTDSDTLAAAVHSPFMNSGLEVLANKITVPTSADLSIPFNQVKSHFVPITPRKSNITDLRFIINPIEDPYKAYSEQNVQTHPSVTIIMTMDLSSEAALDYPGTFLPVTVQATVSAGVLGKITSYPPTNDVSWIQNVITGARVTP